MLAGLTTAVVASSMSSSGMHHPGDMSFLTGTWSCVAKMNAMPGSPAHTENDTMTFHPTMNGMWTSQTYVGKGYSGQAYWRWDKATNMLVSVSVDSFGGYGTSTSKGMMGGNSMTMTGSMTYAGRSTASSDLLTRTSDTKMRHVGKVQMNGKWMQTDDTVCTKNP
ncbi:MAG: DUF1579 domain-containing protein [Candidatus Eremiobacteraeota bacterium]|nr:DUF1579 domain-containing protein [Candidatus Eremiobacteraeota bacterium]